MCVRWIIMTESKFSYYPEFSDNDFYKKIFLKKEFNMFKIPDQGQKMGVEHGDGSFELMPQQNFLKNYISTNTPYNAILIYHGTGVGKTCAAISIAENFKQYMKEKSTKTLVVVSSDIASNFRNEIFSLDKESTKRTYDRERVVQCTGLAYQLSENDLKYLTRKQLVKKIKTNISTNYRFTPYRKLANDIKRQTNWNGDEKYITEKVKSIIKKRYSNRVIIIDEVQNIRVEGEQDKMVPPIIEAMIKYSENVKLILMSATPMYHSPREIIYILNLMLYTDGRQPIEESDIFDKNDNLIPGGEKKLLDISRGYVSYLRGENPHTFPIRLTPSTAKIINTKFDINGNKILSSEKMRNIKLIPAPMSKFQLNGYLDIVEKEENTIVHLAMISNIAFANKKGSIISPTKSYSEIYQYSNNGRGAFIKEIRKKRRGGKRIIKFKYQSHLINNPGKKTEKPFLDLSMLNVFSSKMAKCIENIKKSKGLVLVFTRYINAGLIPFCLALEQNGFSRAMEDDLLEYQHNRNGGGGRDVICYLCGLSPRDKRHTNQSDECYHKFKQAKYIMITSDDALTKFNSEMATSVFNRSKNMYGQDVKVIVGGETIREGINFKNVRQLHILEPWHNLSKIEQIVGRSIRNMSHVDLPEEERNVDVFLYCATAPTKIPSGLYKRFNRNIETQDIRQYRLSEINNNKINIIKRILQRGAIDCMLNRNRNKHIEIKRRLKDSFGNIIKYSAETADSGFNGALDGNSMNSGKSKSGKSNPKLKSQNCSIILLSIPKM